MDERLVSDLEWLANSARVSGKQVTLQILERAVAEITALREAGEGAYNSYAAGEPIDGKMRNLGGLLGFDIAPA